MVNLYWTEVNSINSTEHILTGPSQIVKALVAIISIILLVVSGFLLFLPAPIGIILTVISFILIMLWNINLFMSKLLITSTEIRRQSLTGSLVIALDDLIKVDHVKVMGTVANTPIAIRKVVLSCRDGMKTVQTLVFPWQKVLDGIYKITEIIETRA